MPKVKKCLFQSIWLTSEKYSVWIICKTEIDLSNMGASALESHAVGKKAGASIFLIVSLIKQYFISWKTQKRKSI